MEKLRGTIETYQHKKRGNPTIILGKKRLAEIKIDGGIYDLVRLNRTITTRREGYVAHYEIVARMGENYYPITYIKK